jgi:hypothetical protein
MVKADSDKRAEAILESLFEKNPSKYWERRKVLREINLE